MPVQTSAHGFEITPALKTACIDETKDKLQLIAQQDFSARWVLTLDHGEHIAHISWRDGTFKGDATHNSTDMYGSIHQCAKLAQEQMKHAHAKHFEKKRRAGKQTTDITTEDITTDDIITED